MTKEKQYKMWRVFGNNSHFPTNYYIINTKATSKSHKIQSVWKNWREAVKTLESLNNYVQRMLKNNE